MPPGENWMGLERDVRLWRRESRDWAACFLGTEGDGL